MRRLTVYHAGKNIDEIEVIKHFIRWQQIPVEFVVDSDKALRLSSGKGFIAIMTQNDQVLSGFQELVQYVDTNGFWLV